MRATLLETDMSCKSSQPRRPAPALSERHNHAVLNVAAALNAQPTVLPVCNDFVTLC